MEQRDKGSPLVTAEPSREPTNSPLNKPPESLPQASWKSAAIATLGKLREQFPAAFARLDVASGLAGEINARTAFAGIGEGRRIIAAMPEIGATDIGLALKLYTGHSATGCLRQRSVGQAAQA
jgi:hypothetical protein